MPPTAGTTEWPRSPALMVKAQSAPGTMIRSEETTQKAAMELAAMEGSPSDTAYKGKLSSISPEGVPKYCCLTALQWKNQPHGCRGPQNPCCASGGRAPDRHGAGGTCRPEHLPVPPPPA